MCVTLEGALGKYIFEGWTNSREIVSLLVNNPRGSYQRDVYIYMYLDHGYIMETNDLEYNYYWPNNACSLFQPYLAWLAYDLQEGSTTYCVILLISFHGLQAEPGMIWNHCCKQKWRKGSPEDFWASEVVTPLLCLIFVCTNKNGHNWVLLPLGHLKIKKNFCPRKSIILNL